ncbi:unnamed protein product [Albugo candida]|uniref:Uncharacterized protein n=1 Tax=Albugo candida TaxID=65357 RepID=A0A024GVT9_9STRA|nr:unnamed protein product [Albugo candida]|eukprot:CCI50547.1 unnamed protein product [Albugo candida]
MVCLCRASYNFFKLFLHQRKSTCFVLSVMIKCTMLFRRQKRCSRWSPILVFCFSCAFIFTPSCRLSHEEYPFHSRPVFLWILMSIEVCLYQSDGLILLVPIDEVIDISHLQVIKSMQFSSSRALQRELWLTVLLLEFDSNKRRKMSSILSRLISLSLAYQVSIHRSRRYSTRWIY